VAEFAIRGARPQDARAGAPFHTWTFPDGTLWLEFHREADGYLLRFTGLADFQVSRDGQHVAGLPVPGVSDETVRHLYLNQVLPLALSRAGTLVFHASAVEIGTGAVAFMGESGRGKSTLAARFCTSGYRFLTDDGLAVEEAEGGYRVFPSQPSIRLWEDSEAALIHAGARKAEPVDYTPKARILADDRVAHCDQPRTLQRIYFLGTGSADVTRIEPVSPSEAFVELVKHSFLLDIEARDLITAQFHQLSRLALEPVYFRLDYPRRFELLGNVQRAILDHCPSFRSSAPPSATRGETR
jgi:hypothetical protein